MCMNCTHLVDIIDKIPNENKILLMFHIWLNKYFLVIQFLKSYKQQKNNQNNFLSLS